MRIQSNIIKQCFLLVNKFSSQNHHTYLIKFKDQHIIIYYIHLFVSMRKLLNNPKSVSTFTSLKGIVQKKATQIKQYDRLHSIRFEKHIRQTILKQERQKQTIGKLKKKYDKICLTAARPVQTLLKEFLSHSKQYNENDLVETAVFLGKAYQMSLLDSGGKFDRFDYKLIESPMFDHFIEEVKYALSQKAYIENGNIARLLNALFNMNYLDMEIVNLALRKIENIIMLPHKEKTNFKQRPYQIQKDGYYNPEVIGLDKAFLNSPAFSKNLAFFQEKKKQFSQKQTWKNVNQSDFGTVQNYNIVVQLLENFQKFNKGIDSIIEGVIAVRRQYHQMVTISNNQKVMRNPELNYSVLLIEEKLLQMHLITIQDIRNPQVIMKQQKQNEKVEQIVKILMSDLQLDNFEDYLSAQKKSLQYLKTKKQKNLYQISKIFQALAKYASLPHRLYGNNDKITLLTTKWQRYFLEDKFTQYNIEVQRLFRRAFIRTHAFFSRHLPMIQFSLIESSFKSKIHWYSALAEMGYYEDLAAQFKGVKFSRESIIQLQSEQLLLFLKVLNNLCQTDFKVSDQVNNYIQERLFSISQEEPQILNIKGLCDAINYLYQARPGKKLNEKLYKKLINMLSQEVSYIQQHKNCPSSITKQAKRILFFEDPTASQYQGSLQQLKEIEDIGNEKSNPYIKLLYDTFNTSKSPLIAPYLSTGVNENNQLTGIYFANSDCSGVIGNLVSGHTNAYCMRLYNKFGVKVTAIPMNKFVELELPPSLNSQQYFNKVSLKMKKSEQILSIMAQHLPRNNQAVVDFIKNAGNLLKFIAQQPGSEIKVKKIVSSLKRIASLFNQQKNILLINQFYSKRSNLLVELHLLKRDFNLLTKQQIQKIKSKAGQKSSSLEALLTEVIKQIEKPFVNIQKILKDYEQKDKSGKQLNFKGKRTTLNTILDQQQKQTKKLPPTQQSQYQFLSMPYLLDFRYVEYQDWRNKLKETGNFNQIKLSQASDLTKILTAKFCPNVKETLFTTPDKFIVPFYPLNWQNKYYYHPQNSQENQKLQEIAEGYRQAHRKVLSGTHVDQTIKTIQNFKNQLKMTKTPKQILETILNLDFINNLLAQKLKDKKDKQVANEQDAVFLQRNAKEYFNYLEKKADKAYLESPFLQYIFNKIQETQRLKQKVQERKTSKHKLSMLLGQGVIGKKQYFEGIKKIDQKLIDEMKGLKKKLLSHVDGVQVIDEASKIVQLNKNINDLERVVQGAYYYDHSEDPDFIAAGGDYNEALKIKRNKAETNLILYRILYQLTNKQNLSEQQSKFLKNWKKQTIEGISAYKVNKDYTKLAFKSLSAKDKKNLVLSCTNFDKVLPNLALNDLILQLSNFLDETLIHKLQAKVYAEHFSQQLNIPASVFSTSSNKVLKMYNQKVQQAIFEQNSQLNPKQIDCLIQMSKIFKTEGLSDRQRYQQHYKNLRENLELINKCKFRNPLFSEYLKQKDYEYYHSYYPEDVRSMKKGQVGKLWKSIFQNDYQHTKGATIRAKVNQICERMLMIKLNVPPYFGNLVLEILKNQKTDKFTKQKLIAYIQLFKVPLQLDSLDLIQLVQPENFQTDKLMDSMRKVSNENFTNSIYAYL